MDLATLSIGPVNFYFNSCWVLFLVFYPKQILIEVFVSKQSDLGLHCLPCPTKRNIGLYGLIGHDARKLLSFGSGLLRCRIDGTTESVMVAYTHKCAKV